MGPGETHPGHRPITVSTSTPSLRRISLTRQQPSGTAGIRGETGKGMLPKLVGTLQDQPWDGVQGCGGRKDSQWVVGRAVLLLHLGCWAAPLPSSPKQLLPEDTGCSAKAPRCRNWKGFREQGRVLESRHTSQHVGSPSGWRREGREASARGQARGGPWRTHHALLETSGLGCGGVH